MLKSFKYFRLMQFGHFIVVIAVACSPNQDGSITTAYFVKIKNKFTTIVMHKLAWKPSSAF